MDDSIESPTLEKARNTVERALKCVNIQIHPSMAIFLAPSLFEDENNISNPRRLIALPYVNPHTPVKKDVFEIQNKLLGNPTKTTNHHLDNFGRDIKWIVLKRTKCFWASSNDDIDEKCASIRLLGTSMLRRGGDAQGFEKDDDFQRYIKTMLSTCPPKIMSASVEIECFHLFNKDTNNEDFFRCLKAISMGKFSDEAMTQKIGRR